MSGRQRILQKDRLSAREVEGVVARLAAVLDFARGPVILQVAGVLGDEGAPEVARALACGLHAGLMRRCCVLELLSEGHDSVNSSNGISILELSEAEFNGLVNGRLRSFVAECSNAFDIFIVNSGAVLVSGRSCVIADQTDGVILVLESERTTIADAKSAQALIAEAGARLLGVVVSRRRHRLPRWLGWIG